MKVVAVLVETETQTMVWPIADLEEARTYCEDEEPVKLVIFAEAEAAVKQARIDALEEARNQCDALAGLMFCHGDKEASQIAVSLRDAIESLKGKTP